LAKLKCPICNYEKSNLVNHVKRVHGLSPEEVKEQYPDDPLTSEEAKAMAKKAKALFQDLEGERKPDITKKQRGRRVPVAMSEKQAEELLAEIEKFDAQKRKEMADIEEELKKYPDCTQRDMVRDLVLHCFLGDQLINCPNGEQKCIKDIRVGDYVLDSNGLPQQVMKTNKRRYIGNMLVINTYYNPNKSFLLTPNHPILSIKRNNIKCKKYPSIMQMCPTKQNIDTEQLCIDCKYKQQPIGGVAYSIASCLEVGDYIATQAEALNNKSLLLLGLKPLIVNNVKEMKNINGFLGGYGTRNPLKKRIPSHIELSNRVLRLFGLYLAEGYIIKENDLFGGVGFGFHILEDNLAKEVLDTISSVFKIKGKIYKKPKTNSQSVVFYSRLLAEVFYNLLGSDAQYKKISKTLFLGCSAKQLLQIVSGFIDGDGHIYKRARKVLCASISKTLIWQLWIILRNNNFVPSLKLFSNKVNKRQAWSLCLYGDDALKFSKLAGNDNYNNVQKHPRSSLYFCYMNKVFVPIKSIQIKEFNGFVYNLAVRDNPTYLASNCVVHNCRIEWKSYMAFKRQLIDMRTFTSDFERDKHSSIMAALDHLRDAMKQLNIFYKEGQEQEKTSDIVYKVFDDMERFVQSHVGEFSFRCKNCNHIIEAGGLPKVYYEYTDEKGDTQYHVWSERLYKLFKKGIIEYWTIPYIFNQGILSVIYTFMIRNSIKDTDIGLRQFGFTWEQLEKEEKLLLKFRKKDEVGRLEEPKLRCEEPDE